MVQAALQLKWLYRFPALLVFLSLAACNPNSNATRQSVMDPNYPSYKGDRDSESPPSKPLQQPGLMASPNTDQSQRLDQYGNSLDGRDTTSAKP